MGGVYGEAATSVSLTFNITLSSSLQMLLKPWLLQVTALVTLLVFRVGFAHDFQIILDLI